MGQPSRIHGRIELEIPFIVTSWPPAGERRVKFEVKEVPVETERYGTVFVKQVVAIVPTDQEDYSAHELEAELKDLRQMARAAGAKNFHGYIYRVGTDDPGDVARFSFEQDNHRLKIEMARLAWPDGTVVRIP